MPHRFATRRASGGSSAGIDPGTLLGAFLRLDGAAVTGKNHGDSLTTWNDTSGNGRNATTTGIGVVPKYIRTATLPSGADKGMAWYNPFDGAGSQNGGLFPESTIDQGTGFTYYFWLRSFNAASQQILFQDTTGGRPSLLWASTNGKVAWSDANGLHDFTAPTTGYHSVIYVFNPPNGTGSGAVYLDGRLLGTAVWSWNVVIPTGYLVGANQVGNLLLDAWMAEIIGFAGAHSDATRQGVRQFLVNKWTWG